MRTGAVIVAAGMSSRMNDFKPMLKIGSITVVRRIISTLQQAGVDPVVLITGNQAEMLEKHVSRMGIICLRNEAYASSQMLDSAKIGLSYLQNQCDRILFTPVDIPLFTSRTVRSLLESDALIAAPVCGGHEGHPLMMNTQVVAKILDYQGDGGLKGAIESSGFTKHLIEVEDEGVLFDMDTPEDYAKLLSWHNRQMYRPQIQIRLAREYEFFGPGSALLLRLIRNTGSVRLACEQMNISYSKGWKIINVMEKQLEYAVVDRFQGGINGGNTQLTERGDLLLKRYDAFEAESKEAVQKIFEKHFINDEDNQDNE